MLITMPASPVPSSVDWRLRQPTQANRSEFTGRRRVTILAEAPRWSAQVKLPAIRGEKAVRPWRTFLARTQGQANSFRLEAVEGAQFAGPGIVVVDGAGQTGFTLATKGWRPDTYIQDVFVTVADQLVQVVGRVIAGTDGRAVLPIMPHLRLPTVDGVAVEVVRPYALVSMAGPEAGWLVDVGQRYSVEFAVEEAF